GGSTTVAPAVRGSAGGGGGGSSHGGGGGGGNWGGGGGGGGEALVILAVVAVVIAAVAAVALVASEGVRYDGDVQIAPGQPLYLTHADGSRNTVALGDLSPEEARITREAMVKDDEAFGMHDLGRAPLDRTGMAFKLD